MNVKLLEILLRYFKLNEWKPTKGLSKRPPFNKWSFKEIQDHVLAMSQIGLLEKREGTTTNNALFRISTERASWWRDALVKQLENVPRSSELDFRTLYTLYVIGTFYLEHNRPPRQRELYYSDGPGRHRGLINSWLESSGAIAEDPQGIAGHPHIRKATIRLAELGYMIERGGNGERRPYLLTEKGIEFVKELQTVHWRDWAGLLR